MRTMAPMLCAVLVALSPSACSSSSHGPSGSVSTRAPGRRLSIIVGENTWGSIVAQLAGNAGSVTSVVSDPNADPHGYESSATDARAFATADYVVINGAGYDAWAQKLLSANPSAHRRLLDIAAALGKHNGDNPHFWYDPADVDQVADHVTADLAAMDPGDAAYFTARRASFAAALGPERTRLAAIRAKFGGTPVAATESIVVYLADNLGLSVRSPTDFMDAVAEGSDPPTPSVIAFQQLLSNRAVKVLIFNRQTATAVTTNIEKQAAHAGIPVVGVTETIQPSDLTFEDWFTAQLVALANALNTNAPGA